MLAKTFALLTALLIVSGMLSGAVTRYLFQESALMIWSRYALLEILWQQGKYPSLHWLFSSIGLLIVPDPANAFDVVRSDSTINTPSGWLSPLVGYSEIRQLKPLGFASSGKVQSVFESNSSRAVVESAAQRIRILTVKDFQRAIDKAVPGQTIELLPGEYQFTGHSIELRNAGTRKHPITITAAKAGSVTLNFNLLEGFHVSAPYWVIQNLVINGTCKNDSYCEHAFHVVGKAHHTVIRNNWVVNFNAPVKVNKVGKDIPDAGLIEYNSFPGNRPRQTGNPVTFLDIVAVSDWVVRKNLIADFAKLESNRVSYGAFFKGAGERNVFEQNLVICEWRSTGGIRIGFSFGGGGTSKNACRDQQCEYEQNNSTARNNIIMNCPRDVGIYVNKSANSTINNNLLYNTRGIDIRFPESGANIQNNIIDGRILSRNGGQYTAKYNITSLVSSITLNRISESLFAAPFKGDFRLIDGSKVIAKGGKMRFPGLDLCGRAHPETSPDIGPFNYQSGLVINSAKQSECLPVIPLID